MNPVTRGPGRPPDADIDVRVRAAVLAELSDHGITKVTLASVARRAGIAKSTAYARWETVSDLLADVLVDMVDLGPAPDTGSLRGDLEALARQIVAISLRPPMLELHMQFWLMGARAPQRYRDFQRTGLGTAVRQGHEIFAQARDRDELRPDLDVDAVMTAFIGSLMLRALSSPTHSPPTPAAIRRIVTLVVDQLTVTYSESSPR